MQQWFRNDAKFTRKECLPAGKTLSKHSVQFWEGGVFRLSGVLVRPETIEKEAILLFFITFKQQLVSVDNGTGQVGLSRPIKSSFSVWVTTGCCQGGFWQHKPQVSTVKPAPEIAFWGDWNHQCMRACVLSSFSRGQLSATPWTVARQAPLSMGFSRQEYWSGLQCPSPEDLANPSTEPRFLKSPALAGRFFTTSASWEAWNHQGFWNQLSSQYWLWVSKSFRTYYTYVIRTSQLKKCSVLVRWKWYPLEKSMPLVSEILTTFSVS